jgi:hypothetical protein
MKKPQSLPTDAKARKAVPLCTGVFDYFPDALAEVAIVSQAGNDQHNPGQPLHWSKHKSSDHADCLLRHQLERGTLDTDGMRHSAKVAWRALAQLQIEIEAERAGLPVRDYLAKLREEAKEAALAKALDELAQQQANDVVELQCRERLNCSAGNIAGVKGDLDFTRTPAITGSGGSGGASPHGPLPLPSASDLMRRWCDSPGIMTVPGPRKS